MNSINKFCNNETPLPIFEGQAQKMQLVSNNTGYGPCPEPDDEVEQHLTITADGRVWFSGYNFRQGFGKCERSHTKNCNIGKEDATRILNAIGTYFSDEYDTVFTTDIGSWDMTITNTDGKPYKCKGSLCCDFDVDGVDLSDLIRDTLDMPNLFVFDGHCKPDCVDKIAINYHRVTKIKPGMLIGSTVEYCTWDYSEQLVIDREIETLEHIQRVGTGCVISRKYYVQEGIANLLDSLDADSLFEHITDNGPDVIADLKETKDYEITVKFKKRNQLVINGTYDKNGLPSDFPELAKSILGFMQFYDIGEILDPSIYSKTKRKTNDYIFCSATFEDGGKSYYYLTDDDSIVVGDSVTVPTGEAGHTAIVKVVDIEYFQEDNIPFPLERTKTIICKVPFHEIDYIGSAEIQDDEQQFFALKDSSGIDVLDESLYSYDSTVFALTSAVQRKTSEGLINKVKQFVNSVPAAQKAKDYITSKTEYAPRLDLISDEIQQALQNGTAEIIPCKDLSNSVYLQIRATIKGLVINGKEYGKNRKIKDIPIGTKQVPTDVAGAMQCLALQNQLNQIANELREISEVCEFNFGRIIQGQRDDRLAKLLSSRSCFVQALAMSDESLQRQMLLQAVWDANSARAELAFQIKSDILLLGGDKSPKSKDMEKMVYDINTAIVAINNAVQLSLYSYQVLGESASQLAVVKEYETFIKQVLLKEIELRGNKHLAWKLICSSGNSGQPSRDFGRLPAKLIESCTAFIEGNREITTNLLGGKSNG